MTVKDVKIGQLFFMYYPWDPFVMLTTPKAYISHELKRVQYIREVTVKSIDYLPYGVAQEHYEVSTINDAKSYIKYEFYGN